MIQIKSIQNAEHYTWGSQCDGWHLLKTEGVSIIRERMPAGTSEHLHYHAFSQQLFYILSGEATCIVEDQHFLLTAHESIHIPRGMKHCISNNAKTVLEFIVISEPKAHGDRHSP